MPLSFRGAAGRLLLGLMMTALAVSGLVACDQVPVPAKVIVVAASATRNEPAAVLAAADLMELRRSALSRAGAIAYVVDPNTGQPTTVPLTPRRPDGQVEYGSNRDALLAANLDQAQRLLREQAADKPFDLLFLLAAAIRVSSVPGTLIVVSSGLSTAGGFDLRQVGWDASPAAVAAQLGHDGLLPALAGWHVEFSGLGQHRRRPARAAAAAASRTGPLHHGDLPQGGRRIVQHR